MRRTCYNIDSERETEERTMTFKITIKEVHEAVVEIDAENYYEALAKVESDYWENPNDYLLEPKDTTFE